MMCRGGVGDDDDGEYGRLKHEIKFVCVKRYIP